VLVGTLVGVPVGALVEVGTLVGVLLGATVEVDAGVVGATFVNVAASTSFSGLLVFVAKRNEKGFAELGAGVCDAAEIGMTI
jgi:hypothetical protein